MVIVSDGGFAYSGDKCQIVTFLESRAAGKDLGISRFTADIGVCIGDVSALSAQSADLILDAIKAHPAAERGFVVVENGYAFSCDKGQMVRFLEARSAGSGLSISRFAIEIGAAIGAVADLSPQSANLLLRAIHAYDGGEEFPGHLASLEETIEAICGGHVGAVTPIEPANEDVGDRDEALAGELASLAQILEALPGGLVNELTPKAA